MASTSYQSEKFDLFSFVAPKKSRANNAFENLSLPVLSKEETEIKLTEIFSNIINIFLNSNLKLLKLFAMVLKKNCFIAGGFIRDTILITYPKDIDIYFTSKEAIENFKNNIVNKFPKIFKKTKLENCNVSLIDIIKLAFKLEPAHNINNAFGNLIAKLTKYLFIPFNLIFYKYGAPEKVISTFDFKQNSFAFVFETNKLVHNPENFLMFLSPKTSRKIWQILLINKEVDNPLSAMVRAFKFIKEKNFKIEQHEVFKLAKLINNNSSKKEEWTSLLDGMS